MHISCELNISQRRIVVIEIDVHSLKCLWTNFYEAQISYIKRSQASRRSIVREVNVRSTGIRDLENVRLSSQLASTYNVAKVAERLTTV